MLLARSEVQEGAGRSCLLLPHGLCLLRKEVYPLDGCAQPCFVQSCPALRPPRCGSAGGMSWMERPVEAEEISV